MEQKQSLHLHHLDFVSTQQELQDHGVMTSSLSSPKQRVGSKPNNPLTRSSNDNGRERLKRHRSEVAGRVVVPDKWSQEEMLKDWLDFSSFDALLAPKGFDLARAALVAERRQANKESTNNKACIGMHFSATRCS